MSVSKPFVFALVCQALGPERGARQARRQQHRAAVQLARGRRAQPPTAARTPWSTRARSRRRASSRAPRGEAKWQAIHDGLSRFAGRDLALNDEVYRSASATQPRTTAPSRACSHGFDRIYCDPGRGHRPLHASVLAQRRPRRDLALMGATLADGGVNPLTRERVVEADVCRYTLAVMTTAGLYETSGDWLYDVGLPGKSGIGGGHRHGLARQGRARHVRAAARRGRQQRQGAARGALPVAAAGARPVRARGPSE